MFMIEKSLMVIIFVYGLSISLLGVQYIFADVFHITLTNTQGQPLKNNLLVDIKADTTLSGVGTLVAQTNSTNVGVNGVAVAAQLGWDLVLLIFGVYIFQVMAEFGVPIIFIIGFVILYLFLLMRSIMGYIRGI